MSINIGKFDLRSNLEKQIDDCLTQMKSVTADSPEYTRMAENLRTLCEAKTKERSLKIDPNVLISATVNLVGIGMILVFEGNGIIHSKALSFIAKPKI